MKSFNLHKIIGALIVMLSLCFTSISQANTNHCSAPEYRQFDFWVGAWEARDRDNRLLGYQLIEKIERDCVLQEWWRGATEENGQGTSLSIYDSKKRMWNHTWMSVRGNLQSIDGIWTGQQMLMTGYYLNAQGYREFHRTQWKPLEGGRVYHLWDSSIDGGATWNVVHEAWLTKTTNPIQK